MDRITMAHGAGGTIMGDLIKNHVLKYLGGSSAEVPLEALDDSAVVDNIVLKSDSHAVKPLFFPGGDIGRLAVAGTVNDIAMIGAEPIGSHLWHGVGGRTSNSRFGPNLREHGDSLQRSWSLCCHWGY